MLPRRDSILKHFGSVKSEKRVSIKNDAPIVLEYISETKKVGNGAAAARSIAPTSASAACASSVVAATLASSTTTTTAATLRPNASCCSLNGSGGGGGSFDSLASTTIAMPPTTTTARPASLILSGSVLDRQYQMQPHPPQRPVFKLVRSPSIDRQDSAGDSDAAQLVTVKIHQPGEQAPTTTMTVNGGCSRDVLLDGSGLASSIVVVSPTASSQASQKQHTPDDDDESQPLVLTTTSSSKQQRSK